MPDINGAIGANVRAELARAGLSGRRMAAALGWNRQVMADRLSGAVPFRADELASIAQHLGVPITRFYADPDAPKAAAG